MLSWVEHEKSSIISGQGQPILCSDTSVSVLEKADILVYEFVHWDEDIMKILFWQHRCVGLSLSWII